MVLLVVPWLRSLPVLTLEGPRDTMETLGLGPVKLHSTLTLCFPGHVAEGRSASQCPGSCMLVSAHTLGEVTVLLGHLSSSLCPPLGVPGLVSTCLTEQMRCWYLGSSWAKARCRPGLQVAWDSQVGAD